MIVSKDVENALKSQSFIKPKLEFEKYNFVWLEPSIGIKSEEEQEFKHFIKNALPLLPDLLRELRIIEDAISKNKKLDTYLLGSEVFTPMTKLVHGSHHDDYSSSFIIEFASDGAIFVDREEDILVPVREGEDGCYHSQLHLHWQLGDIRIK